MTGDDDTRAQFDQTAGGQGTDLLEVLLTELEADDGTNSASLRRALDLERTADADRIVEIEDDLETLRTDVDDRAAVDAELQAAIENDLEPRLDSLTRRLQGVDDQLTALESETREFRSELAAVRESLVEVDTGTDADDAHLDALADDLETFERTVTTAFDAVTSDLETDLEQLQSTLRDDIASLERRLAALEEATATDVKSELEESQRDADARDRTP
ncbi:hypothetical protein HYG81_17080 [Natrinema zhouii]|uniref:Uncharacterized protein n=1 Tax=Natrinema zhouii TaxID=1710539 RepID=A0A7D6CPW7_9EURY|nr:hypothetical protein [Natrinema zhouii]QLK25769.1 hypothetical protein HYG81_17080 [Natrinema zhouii]